MSANPKWKSSKYPSLESLLIGEKLLSPSDVPKVHAFMNENDCNFGTALLFLGLLPSSMVGRALMQGAQIETVDARALTIGTGMKNILPPEKARAWQVFPLNFLDESGTRALIVGMTDPLDTLTISKIESHTHMKVIPYFIPLQSLQLLMKKYYRKGLDLFPPDVTGHSKPAELEIAESVSSTLQRVGDGNERTELVALLTLLIRKGVVTLDEYREELSKQCS